MEAVRRDLPTDIEAPQIAKFDYNARPVMVLGVTGEGSLESLRTLAEEQVKPRLSEVPGLGSVATLGGRQREVQIRVDPERLEAAGPSLLDLLRPLRAASQSAPAGSLIQGERDVAVRVLGEYSSLEDLRNTSIPTQAAAAAALGGMAANPMLMAGRPKPGPSAPLRLRDVAEVTDTVAEPTQLTRVGGRDSIGLVLSRLSDANTVHVAEGVRHALEALKERLPAGVRITVLQDNSTAVADALEDINFTLILASLLAVLVVLLFMHSLKDTLIIACAIPTSIIATFTVMYFAGFSLNQMTMLALSLSVGILVDDSILVLESIHRHRAMGKEPAQAALDGREEIGLADAANTFVDVVVFVPIAFMGGVVGQFFREFGLTITTATLASLYISFSLTPMLAARWFRKGEELGEPTNPFAVWFDRRYEAIERKYRRLLAWSLRHRPVVVGAGFGALALVGFISWQSMGFDFAPSVDRGQVSVRMELPPGSSLQTSDRVMRRVEAEAAKIPEIAADRMLASVGEILGGFGSVPDRGSQFGQLSLTLLDKQSFMGRLLRPGGEPGRRVRTDAQIADDLRQRLASLPEAPYIQVTALRGVTANLAPLQIGLYGNDLKQLERLSTEIARRISRLPQLQNVDTSMRSGKPELQVVLDRERAEDTTATAAELSGVLRTAIAGNTDLRYRENDRAFPIRIALDQEGPGALAAGPEAIRNLVVASRGGTPVYVGDIADVRLGAGPTKIMRSHRTRKAVVSAYLPDGVSLGTAQAAVKAAIGDLPLDGVRFEWEGDVDEMQESGMSMASALVLGIALSYMLMAAVFNSLVLPLSIMVSVPMALVGGLLGLLYARMTMNIVSMVGIVMLVGLVAKNAILLVDYTNTLRQRGLSRDAALESAGPVRLRPILMTTASTVFAMTPVALQIGRASEMRSPMAVVVIGGLLLSTLLTLLVVPVMYSYFDDMGTGIVRAWRRVAGAPAPDEAEEARPAGPAEAQPWGTPQVPQGAMERGTAEAEGTA